jgi:multiple sugar transport system ATP-binding protein
MTMGDRVAVIRKGELQQADTPQTLYDHPKNLFVAGFIGSPAMNLLEATIVGSNGSAQVEFGDIRLALPDDVLAARPALKGYEGRPVVLGIRPEDMEDASLVSDAPPERRFAATVGLREALGSDVIIHFAVNAAQAMSEQVKELAEDVGQDIERVEQEAAGGETTMLARLNPRTTAAAGQRIELVADTRRLHFFDPDDGSAISQGAAA